MLMLAALQKWLPPSRINAVMGFLWLSWPLHWIQVLAFRVMLGSSWEQVPSFKGHLGDMLGCFYHLGPVLVPHLAFVEYVRPFLKNMFVHFVAILWPCWHQVWLFRAMLMPSHHQVRPFRGHFGAMLALTAMLKECWTILTHVDARSSAFWALGLEIGD